MRCPTPPILPATTAGPSRPPPVAAPDFSFELPRRGQQTIVRPDANEDTLLVLYSLPDSLARLRSLASQRHAFDDRRIRVLALAASAGDAQIAEGQIPGGDAIRAIAAPDVAVVYAMFAARRSRRCRSRRIPDRPARTFACALARRACARRRSGSRNFRRGAEARRRRAAAPAVRTCALTFRREPRSLRGLPVESHHER